MGRNKAVQDFLFDSFPYFGLIFPHVDSSHYHKPIFFKKMILICVPILWSRYRFFANRGRRGRKGGGDDKFVTLDI